QLTWNHPSELYFWQVVSDQLIPTLHIPWCTDVIAAWQFPHELLPNQFQAWAPVTVHSAKAHADLGPAIYTWDLSHHTYLPSDAEQQADPEVLPTIDLWQVRRSLHEAMADHD